jgi:hypothetical protein
MKDYAKKAYHRNTMTDKDATRYGPQSPQRLDIFILLLILAVFLLDSPFFQWWATAERAWYLPYLVWGGVILLIYVCQRWHHP